MCSLLQRAGCVWCPWGAGWGQRWPAQVRYLCRSFPAFLEEVYMCEGELQMWCNSVDSDGRRWPAGSD